VVTTRQISAGLRGRAATLVAPWASRGQRGPRRRNAAAVLCAFPLGLQVDDGTGPSISNASVCARIRRRQTHGVVKR